MGSKLVLQKFIQMIDVVYSSITFILFVAFCFPLARFYRNHNRHWVIGGHRGRIYEDNSASLHQYIINNTTQKIVWITSSPAVFRKLKEQNIVVLKRHSLKARWRIATAPVLIYSHGEDDLDLFLILLRKTLGLRIYITHSTTCLVGVGCFARRVLRFGYLRNILFRFLLTDFDYLLVISELEKKNFSLGFPHRAHVIILGGGPHIDQVMTNRSPKQKTILYFPTSRVKKSSAARLNRIVEEIVSSKDLLNWLESNDYILKIGHHINRKPPVSSPESSRIQWTLPQEIIKEVTRCSLFISDYSGLLTDYLIMDRPVVFFPFDIEQYIKQKRLFMDYEDYAYGPIAYSVKDLIKLIVSEEWNHLELFSEKRSHWKRLLFPHRQPVYAQNSYQQIKRLLNEAQSIKDIPDELKTVSVRENKEVLNKVGNNYC